MGIEIESGPDWIALKEGFEGYVDYADHAYWLDNDKKARSGSPINVHGCIFQPIHHLSALVEDSEITILNSPTSTVPLTNRRLIPGEQIQLEFVDTNRITKSTINIIGIKGWESKLNGKPVLEFIDRKKIEKYGLRWTKK